MRKRRFRFWPAKSGKDELEKYLQTKTHLDERIPDFLHDYLQFKQEAFDNFDSMVSLTVAQPAATPPRFERKLRLRTGVTFTDYLSRLRAEMRAISHSELIFW